MSRYFFMCILMFAFMANVKASDWPTHQNNNNRTAITEEDLELPLKLNWQYKSAAAPSAAWPGKAKYYGWRTKHGGARINLYKDPISFDHAFDVIAAEGKVFLARHLKIKSLAWIKPLAK